MIAGSIVLQRPSFDLSSACIALHSLLLWQKPRFVHCGIAIDGGKMWTATLGQGVCLQDSGAVDNIAIPHAWKDFDATLRWLEAHAGKPYDVEAWLIAAVEPFANIFGVEHWQCNGDTFICSSLVGMAMRADDPSLPSRLSDRTVTPNDIGAFLGA